MALAIGALLGAVVVCALVGWVWFLVEAFRVSAWWGLAVFFMPVAGLAFVAFHLRRAWKPAVVGGGPLLVMYVFDELIGMPPGHKLGALLGGTAAVAVFAVVFGRAWRRRRS